MTFMDLPERRKVDNWKDICENVITGGFVQQTFIIHFIKALSKAICHVKYLLSKVSLIMLVMIIKTSAVNL